MRPLRQEGVNVVRRRGEGVDTLRGSWRSGEAFKAGRGECGAEPGGGVDTLRGSWRSGEAFTAGRGVRGEEAGVGGGHLEGVLEEWRSDECTSELQVPLIRTHDVI